MKDLWKNFAADFNAMSDEEIEQEYDISVNRISEEEEWVEAVESWKAAGKPRSEAQ